MLSSIAWLGRKIDKRAFCVLSLALLLALLAGCRTTYITNTTTATVTTPGPVTTATLPVTVTTTATATATATLTPPTVTALATVATTVPTTLTVTQTTTITASASASALGGQLAAIALAEKDLPEGWVEVGRDSRAGQQGAVGELVINFMARAPKPHEASSFECDLVLFRSVGLAQQAVTPFTSSSLPGLTMTKPAIGDEAYTYAFSSTSNTSYASLVVVIARKGAYVTALSCYGQQDGMDQTFIDQAQGWVKTMVGRMP